MRSWALCSLSRTPFYSLSNGKANGLSPEGQKCPAWHAGALGHYYSYYSRCTCQGRRALLSLCSQLPEIHPPGPKEAPKHYSAHRIVYIPGITGISCVTRLSIPFNQSRGVRQPTANVQSQYGTWEHQIHTVMVILGPRSGALEAHSTVRPGLARTHGCM